MIEAKEQYISMAIRKVTEEERKIIMEHPELVMFHAQNDKRDFISGITMIIIPALIAVFGPVTFPL